MATPTDSSGSRGVGANAADCGIHHAIQRRSQCVQCCTDLVASGLPRPGPSSRYKVDDLTNHFLPDHSCVFLDAVEGYLPDGASSSSVWYQWRGGGR